MAVRPGRTASHLVTRITVRDSSGQRQPDELIVEEPMEIHLDGVAVATTMRTPGHDFELAAGFCFTEGLLGDAEIRQCRYCATGSAVDTAYNVVTVETGGEAPTPTPRLGSTTSSCGYCGSGQTLDDLRNRLPIVNAAAWDPSRLAHVPELVGAQQELFERTGAVHAAAAFDRDLKAQVLREDVGRHNAVDKVVGALLLEGRLPAPDLGLYISGRASFEILQKAWAAGFSAVVAVSAPTALAVQTAVAAEIMLVGFVRDGSANLYSGQAK